MARHPWQRCDTTSGLATLLGGLACLVGSAAWAQSKACDELPPDQKAACLMVLACAAIEEDEPRRECFRAAAESFASLGEATDDPDQDVPPATVSAEAALSDAPVEARHEPDRRRGAVEPRTARAIPAPVEERSEASGVPPTPAPVVEREAVQRTVLTIPDRFEARVTHVRKLLRDRQLVVLDGHLLFEGGQAMVSGLKVGDEVRVSRASSLFGRRFRILGPGHRPFTAARIRCERLELTLDTQRKCRLIESAP